MQAGNMNAMPNINVMASQAMQANNMGNVVQNTLGNMQQGNMPAGAINVGNIAMSKLSLLHPIQIHHFHSYIVLLSAVT